MILLRLFQSVRPLTLIMAIIYNKKIKRSGNKFYDFTQMTPWKSHGTKPLQMVQYWDRLLFPFSQDNFEQ